MSSNAPIKLVSFRESEITDYEPLVPEGDYSLKLHSHRTAQMFGTPRLVLTFSITDFGEFHGVMLQRYYGVEKLIGKSGKNGRCKHKRRGDFTIEYFTLFPHVPLRRLDRISLKPLYNSEIVGRVRIVKTNNQQKRLPQPLWHSVIGNLVRVEEG